MIENFKLCENYALDFVFFVIIITLNLLKKMFIVYFDTIIKQSILNIFSYFRETINKSV